MRVRSVQVGTPRTLTWNDRTFETCFVKTPVTSTQRVGVEGLTDDAQSDRSVHGGPIKALYAYPTEHHAYWIQTLHVNALEPGALGENLSTEGLLETLVVLGERFRIGTVEVEISQPRFPCYKMAAAHERADLPHLFRKSGRSGFYLRVIQEGTLTAGDSIEPLSRPEHGVTVHQVVKTFYAREPSQDDLQRVLDVPTLPEEWAKPLRGRLG